MLDLAIDTTALRQDPTRKGAEFKTLTRLGVAGELSLHVADVVRSEFLSQENLRLQERLERLHASARALSKHPLPTELQQVCSLLDGKLHQNRPAIETLVAADFDAWLKSINGRIAPIAPHHSTAVVASYFQGSKPFRKIKERDGFPDAFVVEAIKDVLQEKGTLHVVSGDTLVREALSAQPGATCYSTLKEFLASAECQAVLKQHYAQVNFSNLVGLLPTHEARFLKVVRSKIGAEVSDMPVDWPGSESGEVHLAWDLEPTEEEIDLDYAGVEYYGDGLFVVPFSILHHVGVSYPLSKADYVTMSDEDAESISVTDLNDHYFDAEQEVPVYVSGQLAVQVDDAKLAEGELDGGELAKLLEQAEISLDSIHELRVESDSIE